MKKFLSIVVVLMASQSFAQVIYKGQEKSSNRACFLRIKKAPAGLVEFAIKSGIHRFKDVEYKDEVVRDIKENRKVVIHFDGQSELCDYWDMCTFQKSDRTITVNYNQNLKPTQYVYSKAKRNPLTGKLRKTKTYSTCINLKKK